jgi:hypothetical protein
MIKNKTIKNQKNNIQKDKDKEKIKSKDQKVKFKIIPEKVTILPSKSKQNQTKITKAFTESKKKGKRNIQFHNSISSKEEIKNKLSPSKLRNNQTKHNLMINNNASCSNRFLSSNYLFLTNDTDFQTKDDEKKIKKNKKNYSNGEKVNFPELGPFKKNMLKKTIIIDDDGNNNLNLNLQKGAQHDYKSILDKKKDKIDNINNNESNSFSANTETNSLFLSSNRSYMENYNKIDRKSKEDEIKQTLIDKNEEERRLKEYNKIFNLLNSNIEQFKKMFNGNNSENNKNIKNIHHTIYNSSKNCNYIMNNNSINKSKNKNKNKKIIIKNKKNQKISIQDISKSSSQSNHKTKKFNNYKMNLKINLSDKNISSTNNKSKPNQKPKSKPSKNKTQKNLNIFTIDIGNDFMGNKKCNKIVNKNNENEINNNYSFLESSIQDDFYQSLINQTFLQNVSHNSFEINIDEFSNDSIFENNNCNKIIFTENNKYKKENILSIDNTEIKKKNSGSPVLAPRNRVKENLMKKMQEVDKNNICKTEANNDNDKTNCFIY